MRLGCSWRYALELTPCTRSAGPSRGPPGPDPARIPPAWRRAGLGASSARRHAGAVVHVLRQLLPQPGGVRRAQVDLEVGAVKTDQDVLDILGGPVEVVDEEGAGDGGHADQGTRVASSLPWV